jgi:uncharacterized protein
VTPETREDDVDATSCELPASNASTAEIDRILATSKTIAVVGVSNKPERDSLRVARYLQEVGYRVVPVNPSLTEVLGEPCYPNLAAIPAEVAIDIVDVFRSPEFIPGVVDEAIARGARVVWMQLGLAHNAAAEKARAAGLAVVMDRCLKVEHARAQAGGALP